MKFRSHENIEILLSDESRSHGDKNKNEKFPILLATHHKISSPIFLCRKFLMFALRNVKLPTKCCRINLPLTCFTKPPSPVKRITRCHVSFLRQKLWF